MIKGYSTPFRVDEDSQGVEIMLFVREDIPSKLLTIEPSPAERFYAEINVRKRKWLLCCSCKPNKNNVNMHLDCLSKTLALYSSKYENFIILGDFNVDTDNNRMKVFCGTFNFES